MHMNYGQQVANTCTWHRFAQVILFSVVEKVRDQTCRLQRKNRVKQPIFCLREKRSFPAVQAILKG